MTDKKTFGVLRVVCLTFVAWHDLCHATEFF